MISKFLSDNFIMTQTKTLKASENLSVTYDLIESSFSTEKEDYIYYSLLVTSSLDNNRDDKVFFSDIERDKNNAIKIFNLISNNDVTPISVIDVISDTIGML